MIKSIMNHFKNTRSFKDFYTDWITTLKTTVSAASTTTDTLLLSTHVHLLMAHFTTYFTALDTAASKEDVCRLLYPTWRTDLEKPFLWFGDFHPYVFTNLLRSFLNTDNNGFDPDSPNTGLGPWGNVDCSMAHFVEHLECGLRLMVPAITKRAREAQWKLVAKMGSGFEAGEVVGEVVVEEMTCVFLDANRLRKSVLCDIVAALSVDQAACFLNALVQFYVGFSDSKLIDRIHRSTLSID